MCPVLIRSTTGQSLSCHVIASVSTINVMSINRAAAFWLNDDLHVLYSIFAYHDSTAKSLVCDHVRHYDACCSVPVIHVIDLLSDVIVAPSPWELITGVVMSDPSHVCQEDGQRGIWCWMFSAAFHTCFLRRPSRRPGREEMSSQALPVYNTQMYPVYNTQMHRLPPQARFHGGHVGAVTNDVYQSAISQIMTVDWEQPIDRIVANTSRW